VRANPGGVVNVFDYNATTASNNAIGININSSYTLNGGTAMAPR